MAKIRIQDTAKNDSPSEDGYVAVVDNLILNQNDPDIYEDFIEAEPDERVEMLIEAAKNSKKTFVVTHLAVRPNGTDKIEVIKPENCKIFLEKDKRRRPRFKKSRFTIAMPDKKPEHVNYLQPYAQIIHDLYTQADGVGTPERAAALREKAHKFMFGVMMLTRCR
jgi:hypothetical protein